MGRRLDLQTKLEELLGSENVYFQPPEKTKIHYPCIIYKKVNVVTLFADNNPFAWHNRYQLMYIDKNPDSLVPTKILQLPKCVYDRGYTADNLNHDVFNLYF